MRVSIPIKIKLTESEQHLFDQIDFAFASGSVKARASGKAARTLMQSLIKRRAIPSARRSYFTDPFPGGRGKSHLAVFQSSLKGWNVFETSGFIKRYLRYVICGPDLPVRTMQRFCQIVNEESLDLRKALRAFVRQEIRMVSALDRKDTAEEFYKLALECIPDDLGMVRSIRNAAMRVR
jgi:hypothetical protein